MCLPASAAVFAAPAAVPAALLVLLYTPAVATAATAAVAAYKQMSWQEAVHAVVDLSAIAAASALIICTLSQ